MKLTLPASVQIKGPNGETIEVSAAQVIEYVARTGRTLGGGQDVEGVRLGARIIAAIASGEIAEADWAALRKELAKPSRGWVVLTMETTVPAPPGSEPGTEPRVMRRQFMPSAIDLLPILDGLGV